MADVLKGLCYFAGAAVLAALAIDIGITAYHRANGTPTAEKVLTHIVEANRKTIEAQKITINAQQSELRVHKKRNAELEKRLDAINEYIGEGGNNATN